MRNIYYRLWLKNAATDIQSKKLLDKYGTFENVYKATDYKEDTFLTEKAVSRLADKDLSEAHKIYDECMTKNIKILSPDSKEYPKKLRKMKVPPYVLYATGNLDCLKSTHTTGVVGTRRMTEYGREVTEKFCKSLAQNNITIVTGFAMGVDTEAVKAALSENAAVICVLGGGVDYIYPPTNINLYEKVLEKGVFISEYPPGTKPRPEYFPCRNRIIAGLGDSVLVTEAPEKSGAMITAKHAKTLKKPVFTIPGQIDKLLSSGTNSLLKKGATPAFTPEDILKIYKIKTISNPVKPDDNQADDPVLSLLHDRDMDTDTLANLLGITASECNSKCFMLELEGKIKKLPGGFYHKI